MIDRGLRPYASTSKTYLDFIEEKTTQYYQSIDKNCVNPNLKQPYLNTTYTEMNYLLDG